MRSVRRIWCPAVAVSLPSSKQLHLTPARSPVFNISPPTPSAHCASPRDLMSLTPSDPRFPSLEAIWSASEQAVRTGLDPPALRLSPAWRLMMLAPTSPELTLELITREVPRSHVRRLHQRLAFTPDLVYRVSCALRSCVTLSLTFPLEPLSVDSFAAAKESTFHFAIPRLTPFGSGHRRRAHRVA